MLTPEQYDEYLKMGLSQSAIAHINSALDYVRTLTPEQRREILDRFHVTSEEVARLSEMLALMAK